VKEKDCPQGPKLWNFPKPQNFELKTTFRKKKLGKKVPFFPKMGDTPPLKPKLVLKGSKSIETCA